MARIALLVSLLTSLMLFSQTGNSAPLTVVIPKEPPKGNYLSICQQCTINQQTGIMSCRCPSGRKSLLHTLDMSACPSQNVKFIANYLTCDNTGKKTHERVLSDGRKETSRYRLPPKAVEPLETNYEGLPAGDYLEYCTSCNLKNGILNCECPVSLEWHNATTQASLAVERCDADVITYAKGNLICQKDLQAFVGGCGNCEIIGNTLSCNCPKTPCQWSQEDLENERNIEKSQLENVRYCTQDIANCNGFLRCGKCETHDFKDEYERPKEGTRYRVKCHHKDEL